jgi:alkylation response protein AidB-like acyl-CoA dehydrogenase
MLSRLDRMFARTPEQEERLELIGKLADSFTDEAHAVDEENRFAYTHIDALRSIGYPTFTVPEQYGGKGISLYEFILSQERLAQGDAAIALGIGWHLGVIFDLNGRKLWSDTALAAFNREIIDNGALVNRAATEKASGSPARGGMPLTTAERLPSGSFRLKGRKTFTTLSPVLDIFIVTAALDDSTVEFIVPRETKGLSIDPTWTMTGMRGTASHDLVLDNVIVPEDALVYFYPKEPSSSPVPYLLHIPACYLGIALAARKEALKFASSYQPNSLPHPILYTASVGQQLGQIELELGAARHFLYSVAERWDARGERTPETDFIADFTSAKVFAIQTALSVLDKAMRIVGAHSLSLSHPLQRMYRDVRFGLHNPPMEDQVIAQLGREAVKEAERLYR